MADRYRLFMPSNPDNIFSFRCSKLAAFYDQNYGRKERHAAAKSDLENYLRLLQSMPKVPRYTALCPHPIQGFLEAVGDSESSALMLIHRMLEDTALSGDSLPRLMGEAVVLESSDPRLPGYRMMLIVSG